MASIGVAMSIASLHAIVLAPDSDIVPRFRARARSIGLTL
jgi:hypothetical protein